MRLLLLIFEIFLNKSIEIDDPLFKISIVFFGNWLWFFHRLTGSWFDIFCLWRMGRRVLPVLSKVPFMAQFWVKLSYRQFVLFEDAFCSCAHSWCLVSLLATLISIILSLLMLGSDGEQRLRLDWNEGAMQVGRGRASWLNRVATH